VHKWLPQRKLAKDRAALSSRITYKPYTCIQRALISLATGASDSYRFVIKCAFHLVPTFLRHTDNASLIVQSRCRLTSLSLLDRRESLAVLAKYDTKHNPTIIAMFLSYVSCFCTCVSIAKGKGR